MTATRRQPPDFISLAPVAPIARQIHRPSPAPEKWHRISASRQGQPELKSPLVRRPSSLAASSPATTVKTFTAAWMSSSLIQAVAHSATYYLLRRLLDPGIKKVRL